MFRRALAKIDRRADAGSRARPPRGGRSARTSYASASSVEAAVPLIRARLEKKMPDILPLGDRSRLGGRARRSHASRSRPAQVPPLAPWSSTGTSSTRPSTRSSTPSSRTFAPSVPRRTSCARPSKAEERRGDRARGRRRALGLHRGARTQGHAAPAVQGPRRDEPVAALGDHA